MGPVVDADGAVGLEGRERREQFIAPTGDAAIAQLADGARELLIVDLRRHGAVLLLSRESHDLAGKALWGDGLQRGFVSHGALQPDKGDELENRPGRT